MRSLALASLLIALPLAPACNCQRAENVAAKERLSSPPAPDPVLEQAKQPLNARALVESREVRDRVMRMPFREVAARLGSLKLETEGNLRFSRSDVKVNSSEKVEIVQAEGGDFSVHVVTGDGGEQRLAYINQILFLKNNNGQWRASRDPVGERNELREDSAGIWRSFYDLLSHALVLEKRGDKRYAGRSVAIYALSLPDESAEARALGAKEPVPQSAVGPDGGVLEEDPKVVDERVRDRLSRWREKTRPAGGRGEVYVDMETGALMYVKLDGKLVVGDAPEPGVLKVSLTHKVSEVGKDHEIPAPKDAIEEIARKKWPTNPREFLEKEGLVAPLEPGQDGRGKVEGGDKAKGT